MTVQSWVNGAAAANSVASRLSIWVMGGEEPTAFGLLSLAIRGGSVIARYLDEPTNISDDTPYLPLRSMEIERASLHKWLRRIDPVIGGKKRGRRPIHDWVGCMAHIVVYCSKNGLPTKHADLEKVAFDWFQNQCGGREPDIAEVRRNITSAIYRQVGN